MKVSYENSTEYKILKKIRASNEVTFLRSDFNDLGKSARQISRGLTLLVNKHILVRLGRGAYAKVYPSEYREGEYILPKGFINVAREILTKLGIPWRISEFERLYNEGLSTQVPARPVTIIEKRFRRKLSYRNREFLFESRTK